MFTWAQLRRFQDHKLFTSMYVWLLIVPIFAKISEKMSEQASVSIFGVSLQLSLSLPFSWQIFYFSAISIVIANVIFQIYCPDIVKDHPNFAHFKSEGKELQALDNYAVQLDEAVLPSDKFHSLTGVNLLSRDRPSDEAHIQNIFWSVYSLASENSKGWRRICSTFMLVGIGLITVVIVQNLIWVIRAMLI